MDRFLRMASAAGASATLVHALPRAARADYVARSAQLGIGRIMTFFLGSDAATRNDAYVETDGFTYVVSRFGRTGGADVGIPADVIARVRALRVETTKPLAVGFGIKTARDVSLLHDAGADAVIVGSAASAVVARHLDAPDRLVEAFDGLVRGLVVGPSNETMAAVAGVR
jgi:tryptophan synthase alpha chain